MIGTLHGPWLVVVAVAWLVMAVVRGPRLPRRELWVIAGLVLASSTARLISGLWGPLHVNGQGPLWIRGTIDPDALAGYGPGYFEIFGWINDLALTPDLVLFTANCLLSALGPALLYATARVLGVGRGGALAISLVLAADAVTLRAAASEGYFASIIALVLGVQLSLGIGLAARVRRDLIATGLALGAAGLLAAAAARIHPMAYLPLALSPLVVLGAAQAGSTREHLGRSLAAAAVIGAIVVATSGQIIVATLRASSMAKHTLRLLGPGELAVVVLMVICVWLLRRRLPTPWLPLLAIASLAALLATQDSFGQHPFWQLCYQRIFLPGMLLGAAPLLLGRLQRVAWAAASGVLAALVLAIPAAPYLTTRTTEQLEYEFLQRALGELPEDCMLASVGRAGPRVWEAPSHLLPTRGSPGTAARRNLESAEDLSVPLASGECLLYVRSSLCSSAEGRHVCESIERESTLEELARRVLPAAPSYIELPYDRAEIEVVLFRVLGRQGASHRQPVIGDGAAITPALAQALFERVTALRTDDGCIVTRVDTSRFRITMTVSTALSEEHAIELATAPSSAGRAAGWAIAPAPALDRECATTVAAIVDVLEDLGRHR